jgi:DNA-binding FadR family transcriptional regulator
MEIAKAHDFHHRQLAPCAHNQILMHTTPFMHIMLMRDMRLPEAQHYVQAQQKRSTHVLMTLTFMVLAPTPACIQHKTAHTHHISPL